MLVVQTMELVNADGMVVVDAILMLDPLPNAQEAVSKLKETAFETQPF
jgi:hypothetical protein